MSEEGKEKKKRKVIAVVSSSENEDTDEEPVISTFKIPEPSPIPVTDEAPKMSLQYQVLDKKITKIEKKLDLMFENVFQHLVALAQSVNVIGGEVRELKAHLGAREVFPIYFYLGCILICFYDFLSLLFLINLF